VVRQALHTPGTSRLRNVLDRKLKAIRGKTVEELQAPDIALFDRMKQAILRNNEARAIAAAQLHNDIIKAAKVKVEPLELFDTVALKLPSGEPLRLSPGGTLFLRQLRAALQILHGQLPAAVLAGAGWAHRKDELR
jgi:hypothetical protein